MSRYCPKCQQTIEDDAAGCPHCARERPESGFPEDPRLGTEVAGGQYRVIRRIGTGGFGVVYEVETMVGRLRRALKVLSRRWAEDFEVQERFINEALVLEQVNHPNIARCFAAGRLDSGELYLLFELIDGVQLASLLKEDGVGPPTPLDPIRAVRLAKQVAAGLKAAHDAQVLHRDLKPDNILIASPGEQGEQARVVDFGIAKLTEDGSTTTQNIVGTPEFMPPEQFLPGTALDGRVDIWQLGANLFAMLTGQAPYAQSGGMAAILSHQQARTELGPAPSEIDPALREHGTLDQLVARMLATDPKRRPGSAAEVCELLARIEHGLMLHRGATGDSRRILRSLCASPGEDSWIALIHYLATRHEDTGKAVASAEHLLASWPASLRRAPGALWQQARSSEASLLWPLVRSLDLSTRALGDSEVTELAENPALANITHLNLSANQIGNDGLAALARSVHLSSIVELRLSGNRITSSGLAELSRATFVDSLRSLDVSRNGIGAQGLTELMASQLRLRSLDVSQNHIGRDGAVALAQSAASRELASLGLSETRIGDEGVTALCRSENLSQLRELDLSSNGLAAPCASALAGSQSLASLVRLGLARNRLGRRGLERLLAGAPFCHLRSLDLAANGLQATGAMLLAASDLARRLESLDLSDNELRDAGLAGLSSSPQLSGLRHLRLARNNISGAGAELLPNAPPQLELLDVTHNPLGARGATAIADALTGSRITQLTISGCEVPGDAISRILDAGELETLDASRNPMGEVGARHIAGASGASSLATLCLAHCELGGDGIDALVQSRFLSRLRVLDISSNQLGRQGITKLATSGAHLEGLETLVAEDNAADAEAARALVGSVLVGQLRDLGLAHNQLGDEGAEVLAACDGWQRLRVLDVRRNGISLAGAASLLSSPGLAMVQCIRLSDNPLSTVVDVYALTEPHVAILEETFGRVKTMGADFAERFYQELFTRYPSVRPLFAATDMARQHTHLMGMLTRVIDNLRSPEALDDALRSLGTRHVGYGVAPSHYFAVTQTLLDVLAAVYGDAWSAPLSTAWSTALDAIVNAMLSAPRPAVETTGETAETARERPAS